MVSFTVKLLCALLILSMLLNVWLYYHRLQPEIELLEPAKKFSYLYPPLSRYSHEEMVAVRKHLSTNFVPLKESINSSIQLPAGQTYSVYFENLNTGAWIGLNEKNTFYSGSLRKVPLVIAALKQVEEDNLSLDTPITILPEDINPYSGPSLGAGSTLTLFQLINHTLFYSDNTGANALLRTIGDNNLIETMFNIGLSLKTFIDNKNMVGPYPLSAKEFSTTLRSLYYSTYLTRKDSQQILSLLAHTDFSAGLPAGVPAGIDVAHKVASFTETSQHHDCGIVYYPNEPYLLCIMTKGMSEEESNQLISRISKMAYEYVDS